MERERIGIGAVPELSLQIIDLARERGQVTIADIVRLTGANGNTVKHHLSTPVEERHLEHGMRKASWYKRSWLAEHHVHPACPSSR